MNFLLHVCQVSFVHTRQKTDEDNRENLSITGNSSQVKTFDFMCLKFRYKS